jgi:hypothetical protein
MNQKKCYCPECGTEVVLAQKYRVVLWEKAIRCVELEVVAEDPQAARRKARQDYDLRRDEYCEWDEDCMTTKEVPTGKQGAPRKGIKGGHQLLGIQVEEAD